MSINEEEKNLILGYRAHNEDLDSKGKKRITMRAYKNFLANKEFVDRLESIVSEIEIADNFFILVEQDQEVENGRYYFQIGCYRKDVITDIWGDGYSGKAYLSPHMTKNELVQCIFGLYKGYWEHEARESFKYRGRRVFGPHMDVDAVWTVARKVDVRSAKHVEDRDG